MSTRFSLSTRFLLSLFLATSLLVPTLYAQSEQGPEPDPHDVYKNLKFRDLGPAAAGGRVTSVVGIPGDTSVYYVGAASGGVFKSTNGGISWKPIFEYEATSSIGAIAVAPSNPNLVWVGTGEANIRNDITDGAGVYFSSDAGQTWRFMGLRDAGQISNIVIDPKNPENVFVGVLGHAWAPNSERGVFRTNDGGKSWKKVLYVDDGTGVADLAMQPDNPKVLYAAMWHVRRYPWTLIDGGETSGLYRSTDGGDTWKKLTEDLPKGPLGRIAVAIAPSNPNHIYALIAAKKGLLWQSSDMGSHWSEVSDFHGLDVRPFYFSRMAVAPDNESRLYFLSFTMMESDDGGKTAHLADRGVHPDHHAIWIDPLNPKRILQGNDGGIDLSLDGAKSWQFIAALPIEQFYQVALDSREPYSVCGGLQDNSGWCGPSSNLGRTGITNADWFTVVGGDGEYAVPAPSDPDIVYADAQNGYIMRYNKATHYSTFARPYLESADELPPAELKYRFNWTSPIAVSPKNPNEVYLGANVLFRTDDGGKTWRAVSGDLTRNDKSKQIESGEPVHHDLSGAENYDTILSIALAPTDADVIWVGTDDGCIQVTRDGGKNWTRVDPNISGAPQWGRVYQIGVSPFAAGTAFVTFDAHQLDDRHAYVYKTSDYGQTWQKISNGLPDVPVFVVREDPNTRGLLVLGNERGLFYSHDSGAQWRELKANFPTVPVWDLTFDKNTHDLVVATHGRGMFVFDNIRPVEDPSNWETAAFHLFPGSDAIMYHHWESDEDTPVPFSAPNAPNGATVDYFLKAKAEATPEEKQSQRTPVKIVISDSKGSIVATHYGPSEMGVNRYLWDLRYSGTRRLDSAIPPEPPMPGQPEEARYFAPGPHVVPGKYEVAVTVNGQTQKTTTTVTLDPNLHISEADFRTQTEAALRMQAEAIALNNMIRRIEDMEKQIGNFEKALSADASAEDKYRAVQPSIGEMKKKLAQLKATVYDPSIQHNVEEDEIHALADLHGRVEGLTADLAQQYGEPPNALVRSKMAELSKNVAERLAAYNSFLKNDIASYNRAAYRAGAPTLSDAGPVVVAPPVPLP